MRIALDPQPGPMPNLAERYAPELLAAADAFSVATYKQSIPPLRYIRRSSGDVIRLICMARRLFRA